MGEYAETTFATTVLTEAVVTGGTLSHNGEAVGVEIIEEVTDKASDNEKPNGSIDINMTAGNCYIEFLGGE